MDTLVKLLHRDQDDVQELQGVVEVVGKDHGLDPAKDEVIEGHDQPRDPGADHPSRPLVEMGQAKDHSRERDAKPLPSDGSTQLP